MRRFKRILCVAVLDDTNVNALERAVALAVQNKAILTVVTVAPQLTVGIKGPIFPDLQAAALKNYAHKLETFVDPYRNQIKIETKVLVGTAFLEIIREVLRGEHDFVIKNIEQQDWLERLLGSNDMHLIRKCPCPVWLIKPHAPKAYQCILAAVDVNDVQSLKDMESRHVLNNQIMDLAFSLAYADSTQLHLVCVWDAIGKNVMQGTFMDVSKEKIVAYVEQVKQQNAANLKVLMREEADHVGEEILKCIDPQTHLVQGLAHKEIPSLAKKLNADLIVMGTVTRTGIPGFIIGNTAEAILSQIDSALLAIKPPGFESPVTLEVQTSAPTGSVISKYER